MTTKDESKLDGISLAIQPVFEKSPLKNPELVEEAKSMSTPSQHQESPQKSKNQETLVYLKTEILAGIIVGFVQVPLDCANAFIGHLDASLGMHPPWIVGIICAIFGGSPGMINGMTGGLASMIAGFVSSKKEPNHSSGIGVELLFPATILAGVITIAFGALKLGKFQIMIPTTVKIGFCNGMAIIIAKGQAYAFYDLNNNLLTGVHMALIMIYIIITAIVFDGIPKLKYKWAKFVPSSLVCIILIVTLEFGIVRNCGYSTLTLKDVAPFSSSNAFPKPFFINDAYNMKYYDSNSINLIILNGIQMAFMAIFETTITMEVVKEYVNVELDFNRQFIALGAANILAGFLGSSIGGAMLGISTINFVNGGKGRVSSLTSALTVMIIIFGAYPLLNYIPLGVLVGILFVVVYKTFKWFTLTAIIAEILPTKLRLRWNLHKCRFEFVELVVIIVVTVLAIVLNLLMASIVGIIISGMAFAYNNSFTLKITSEIHEKQENKTVKIYFVEGPAYYATKKSFLDYFDPKNDPNHVVIEFLNDVFMDYTFLEQLNKICKKYTELGKSVKIKKLKRKAELTVEKYSKFIKNIEFYEEIEEILNTVPALDSNCNVPEEYLQKSKLQKDQKVFSTEQIEII